ncbi:restriction endonuclease subunit S [Anoxybacillus sp. J5B_2022]|uniref:restriction endonuclease subunit S n=1 Tax=Anoxybacillus sp. J5B_2022 TaxID=3003246 RepID=UPI0022868F74|nr:restriction endonuclease subunit S [Anoxybacillus sp. J5B_2022]MCZ0755848.1 restriction endonuclease subunit S [Anoxybacillus sp. J5B_2022]
MGFETVKLKDLTINLDNKRKPLNELERKSLKKKGLYPYCGANGVLDYIDEFIFDQEILCIAEDGGSWGFREKCAYIMNEPCWVNNHAHVLVAKENVNVKYLCYYLNYADLSKHITGTTRGKLTKSALEKIEVKIPDYSTQNKIVNALDKSQELIDKRKAQIEALDQLTQSVFLEMFGDPVTNKTWERRLLKDIADVRDGTHDSPKYVPSGYPLVTSKNIKNGKIDLSNVNYISEEDFININKRSKVDIGDIIMPMIGTIGNPIIVDEQPNFAIKNVALIKFNNPCVINIYIKYLLDSHYLDYILNKNKRGGTQKFLSLTDIRNMEIPLPPRDLQDKFSEIVKKIDSQKSILHKSLIELEKNFNSLMQRAFKGELFND